MRQASAPGKRPLTLAYRPIADGAAVAAQPRSQHGLALRIAVRRQFCHSAPMEGFDGRVPLLARRRAGRCDAAKGRGKRLFCEVWSRPTAAVRRPNCKQRILCLNIVLTNGPRVLEQDRKVGDRVVFVTFMQHGFEKGDFRRILDICWFVARPLIGMVTWREREIPGRESK
jgi:hypothetical protein